MEGRVHHLIVVDPGEKRKSLVCLFVGFFLSLFQITCEDISFQFLHIKNKQRIQIDAESPKAKQQ